MDAIDRQIRRRPTRFCSTSSRALRSVPLIEGNRSAERRIVIGLRDCAGVREGGGTLRRGHETSAQVNDSCNLVIVSCDFKAAGNRSFFSAAICGVLCCVVLSVRSCSHKSRDWTRTSRRVARECAKRANGSSNCFGFRSNRRLLLRQTQSIVSILPWHCAVWIRSVFVCTASKQPDARRVRWFAIAMAALIPPVRAVRR